MKSQEFIISELNNLIGIFPTISFKYKFDNTDNTHIIAVEPLKEFEENKEYLNAESEFVYYFENKYLPETVLFISKDSLVTITEPDMIFKSNYFTLWLNDVLSKPEYNCILDLDKIESDNIDYALAA